VVNGTSIDVPPMSFTEAASVSSSSWGANARRGTAPAWGGLLSDEPLNDLFGFLRASFD